MRCISFFKTPVALIVTIALLTACATEERLETALLLDRRTLIVAADVSDRTMVRSTAHTQSEGADAGADAAASLAVDAWGASGELGLYVLVFAPLVIPITIAASGAGGAAAGAASGTKMTRESIEAAIANVQSNFKPREVKALFEDSLVASIQQNSLDGSMPCIRGQRANGCPRNRDNAVVAFDAAMQLVPSRIGAGKGEIDVLTHLTISAQPRGLMKPECITWVHRRAAGNLFDLASGGRPAVMGQVRAAIEEVATQAPAILFSDTHRPAGEAWEQVECRLWERVLARG
jgi:hypothetical protein